MFVAFEPFSLLFWIFVTSLVPGALLSFGIFRKSEFTFTEKTFIGLGFGLILLPLIPFLLYFVAGVHYSFGIAIFSTLLLYVVGSAFFIKNKAYEDVKIPTEMKFTISKKMLISASILLIVLIAFWIRMSTYSPVFQELDPYYYTYAPYQLLTFGENPLNDLTGWYPEIVDNHRIVPALSYLEAMWYSFYTGGGEADNMLLAAIASIYPPIMAALSVFFLYLFVSSTYRREWGVLAAGIASFAPVIIFKTFAGEQEVQPYAFFAIALFMAMYAFAAKKNDMKFAILTGIAFMAVALGSSSQILALAMFLLFVLAQSIVLFFRQETENFKKFLINNGIILVLGPLLGTLLKSAFKSSPSFSFAIAGAIVLVFGAFLYFLPQILNRLLKREADSNSRLISFAFVALVGFILIMATPLGSYVKNIGVSGFGIASFNTPLSRTIAEQGVSGAMLASSIGFVAEGYPDFIAWIMAVPSSVTNFLIGSFVGLVNALLGTSVEYTDKSNSMLLLWLLLFFVAIVYALFKFVKGTEKNSLVLLFAVIILPPMVVGLIKAKYIIYSAFLIAAAIAFVFGEGEDIAGKYLDKIAKDENNAKELKTQAYYSLLIISAVLLVMQFTYSNYVPILLQGSFIPRFQDNPMALQEKFTSFCSTSGDPDICAAARDPMGYASKGTNYQYSYKLCVYSVISDINSITPEESQIAGTRCNRLSDYWTESMEWIRDNTESDSRTTSWWDYGHWINYFGLKNTVLRNEHASHYMIGEVANAYVDGTPEELISFMKSHDSEYALFDMELIKMGDGGLGGKYGALNYLSCARDNQTTVDYVPGQSVCEAEHLWEVIFVPNDATGQLCTISEHSGKVGVMAYKVAVAQQTGTTYLQYYPPYCINPISSQNDAFICSNYVIMEPAYCIGEVTLANGEVSYGTYYLDETYPNGDLKLNKAFLELPQSAGNTYHIGEATSFTLFYTYDRLWLENGEVTDGYGDRKGKFYDSNIYRGLFLNNISGFDLVYTTSGSEVKIYKISE